MRAVRLSDGRLVCFDGNGRLFSFFNLPPGVRARMSVELEVYTLTRAETQRVTNIVRIIRENNGASAWNPVTREFVPGKFTRWMEQRGPFDTTIGEMLRTRNPFASREGLKATGLILTAVAAERAFTSTAMAETGDVDNETLSRAATAELERLTKVMGPAADYILEQGGEDKFAATLVARAKAKGVTVDHTEALRQFVRNVADKNGTIDGRFTPAAPTAALPGAGAEDDD